MALTPARRAWYPGAERCYEGLTRSREEIRRLGGGEHTLPWTLLTGLDAEDAGEAAFREEAFCAVMFETQVGSEDPIEYLDAAVRFSNERLWGTLAASILVSGRSQLDRAVSRALEKAIR